MWRAVAALPSVTGGLLLMLVLTVGLGPWRTPALLLWFAVPLLIATRPGEAVMVRAVHRCRRPTLQEQQLLGPVVRGVLTRSGVPAAAIDWYVTRAGGQLNAYATGRRSIAVTPGTLKAFLAGRLPVELLAAILTHELGHHAARTHRYDLTIGWLAGPGRLASRLVIRTAVRATGWDPGPATGLLVTLAGAATLVQNVQQHHWPAAAMLTGVGAAWLITPPLDAALARAAEHAADRYTRDLGAGTDPARALHVIAAPGATERRRSRLLDRHPSTASRIARLTEQPRAPRGLRGCLCRSPSSRLSTPGLPATPGPT